MSQHYPAPPPSSYPPQYDPYAQAPPPGYTYAPAPAPGAPAPSYAAAPGYGGQPIVIYGPPPPGTAYAPLPAAYGAPPSQPANPDELRTVFISGFPSDVKDRELNNLLRYMPGFAACQMNWKNTQAQGFALFESGAAALAAIPRIANVHFDETSTLRAEMARKNMFTKDEVGAPPAKRVRTFGPPPTGAPNGAHSHATEGHHSEATDTSNIVPLAPLGYTPVTNTRDNPPCTTLFIGNLVDTVLESELLGLFGTQRGFRQLKVAQGAKSTSCFVDYADVADASEVHRALQGAVIPSSSERGGIRIQYSKNPLGKRRDQ